MLLNTHFIQRHTFRILVAGIVITLFYDMLWFYLKSIEYSSDSTVDGGVEKGIRKFSLYMSYISFFFRILMALVFWKDSMDFENIMQGSRHMESSSPAAQRGQGFGNK